MPRALPSIRYRPTNITCYQNNIVIHWENGQSINYQLDDLSVYFYDNHFVTVNDDFFILWHVHNDLQNCTFCPNILWPYLHQIEIPHVNSVEYLRGIDQGLKLHYMRYYHENGYNF